MRAHELSKVSDLEGELRQIDELVAQRGVDLAACTEQSSVDGAGERLTLAAKLEESQVTLASLVEKKERVLEPLRGRAKQAAAAEYKSRAEKDPALYLDEGLEAQLTQQFFAELTKSVRGDPQFAKLLQLIEVAKSAVERTAAQISAEEQGNRARKNAHEAFVNEQAARRREIEATIHDLRSGISRAEMRSQTALMYCAECGTPLGAVPAPAALDEWMTRLDSTAAQHLKQLMALTSNAEKMVATLGQWQSEAVAGRTALLAAIESLSTSLEQAIISSNAQLARALSGSFDGIQKSMNALVARANQAEQRNRAEDFRKFFEG